MPMSVSQENCMYTNGVGLYLAHGVWFADTKIVLGAGDGEMDEP